MDGTGAGGRIFSSASSMDPRAAALDAQISLTAVAASEVADRDFAALGSMLCPISATPHDVIEGEYRKERTRL